MATSKSAPAIPNETYGVGYLYHYHWLYQDFARRLQEVGGRVDFYEVLAAHFHSEPNAIGPFVRSLERPVTLHSFEYYLGNAKPPPKNQRSKVLAHAKNSGCVYIGEHIALMGTEEDYTGTFFTPPGTEEQTHVLVKNTKALKTEAPCPILLENPVQFYNQVGPLSIGQQMRRVTEEADVGILLSLSNISFSEPYHPQDRDEFFSSIPLERVRQLHVFCGNYAEECHPSLRAQAVEQKWEMEMMETLAARDDVKLSSVIFELETGTPSLPEPERLRDYMQAARDLFFPKGQVAGVNEGTSQNASDKTRTEKGAT